mmetsp:Transcript_59629/g.126282  ORF Transcript_59629/g.126282 Transcript_59629/m.126282 type:complete len:206 (+) Transcript_59629:400-1017(+)
MLDDLGDVGPVEEALLEHVIHQPLQLFRPQLHSDSIVLRGFLHCVQASLVFHERSCPCSEGEKHHPDAEDVSTRCPKTPVPNLRRHVTRGASDSRLCTEFVGQPEVNDHHLGPCPVRLPSHHHIGFLEVRMDHATFVQELHCDADLEHDLGHPPLVWFHTCFISSPDCSRQISSEVRLLDDVDIAPILENFKHASDFRMFQFRQQ